jgi:hypothetical protein
MGSVNFVVIVESAQGLLKHSNKDLKFHVPSVIAVGAALGGPAYLPTVTLSVLINLKESSFFSFSTVIRYVPDRARLRCSGKTTVTICL